MKERIWVQEGPMVASCNKIFMVGDFVSCNGSNDTWVVLGATKKGELVLGKVCFMWEKSEKVYIENPDLVEYKNVYVWKGK